MSGPQHISEILPTTMANIRERMKPHRRQQRRSRIGDAKSKPRITGQDRIERQRRVFAATRAFFDGGSRKRPQGRKFLLHSERIREANGVDRVESPHQQLVYAILRGTSSRGESERDGLKAAVEQQGGLFFEIGDWPGYVPCLCDLCGHTHHADLFCIRIAGYTAGHKFVCKLCSRVSAPELLPELERRLDEVYKEEYGPDYKKASEGKVVDELAF